MRSKPQAEGVSRRLRHNIPMERDLLGLVLRDTAAFWTYRDQLKPELFFDGHNARLLKAMLAMSVQPEFQGFATSALAGRLSTEDFDAGGYIFALRDQDEIVAADVPAVLDDLRSLSMDRLLYDLGGALREGSFEPEASPEEKVTKLIGILQRRGDAPRVSNRIGAIADRVVARASEAFQHDTQFGMHTGLAFIDKLVQGFMPGEVIVLGGSPGSGKTALAIQAAVRFAGKYGPGTMFSQEMGQDPVASRELARITKITSRNINRAALNAVELESLYDAADSLKNLPLEVDGRSGLNHLQIRETLFRQKRTEGCNFAFIDHLLFCGPTERRQSDMDRIGANMKGFKELSRELGIPIIILAQLVKEFGAGDWTKVRAPGVNDLWGGAQVEQNADVVLFIHQPSVLLERREPLPTADEKEKAEWARQIELNRGKVFASLGKAREGKGTGKEVGHFIPETMTFADMIRPKAQAVLDLPSPDDIPEDLDALSTQLRLDGS